MSVHELHVTDIRVLALQDPICTYATCSCGWFGFSRDSDQAACADADAHRQDSR